MGSQTWEKAGMRAMPRGEGEGPPGASLLPAYPASFSHISVVRNKTRKRA